MKLLKNLVKTKKCPICLKKNFRHHGKVNNCHPDLKGLFSLIECINCNHKFYSQMPKKKYLDYLYKSPTDYYVHSKEEQRFNQKIKNKSLRWVKTNEKHWIFSYMKGYKKGNYLEIGPGYCNLLKTFKNHGWKCQGLELQPWIKDKGIVHKFNKIKKGKRDVLVIHDVLEHVIDPVTFLKRFSKFQKKTGKVFLAYPNSDSFKAKLLKTKWLMIEPLGHLNFFSKKSTKIMLEKCGYETLVIKATSFVILRKLLRSIARLPITLIIDLFKMNFIQAFMRFPEILLNILDIINGEQFNVIGIKK